MSIFKDNYVKYSQISDVKLIEINDVLVENNLHLELGDEFSNDWAGYSYYFCKSLNDLDEITISSFVYIITWFMTNNPIEINSNIKSSEYYKHDEIINHCLDIYNNLDSNYQSEIELCKELFDNIYNFYCKFHTIFVKRSERMNCLLTYTDMKLFDEVEGKSRSDKLKTLLDYYYSNK